MLTGTCAKLAQVRATNNNKVFRIYRKQQEENKGMDPTGYFLTD
jgi:hypothetical protein